MDETTKDRTCANRSDQRRYLREGESISSLAVFIEVLFTTLIIDTYEERYVATFDVPGEYLHSKIP